MNMSLCFREIASEIYLGIGGTRGVEFYIKGFSKSCKYMREALSGARGYDHAHNRFSLDTHSLHLGIKASVKKKPVLEDGMVD